jgi:hypothetical protein
MARTDLTVNDITRAGIVDPTPVAADVANGNSVGNDGRIVLRVKNTNGSATTRTLTVALNVSVDGQAVTARSYPVAAGVTRWIGPFDTSNYGTSIALNGDNAELQITPFRIAFS